MGLVSRSRPLCCVQYRSQLRPYDQAAFGQWLEGMKSRYELTSQTNYPHWSMAASDKDPGPLDYVELYDFVPKGPLSAGKCCTDFPRTVGLGRKTASRW